jgi:hypothetical protein
VAKVEQLVAKLRAEAEEQARGEFTLDREKAKVKMRQFQLADPHRYVLMLVQAAVLKKATHIRFEVDADELRCVFDGEPFDRRDLDELYTSLFVDRSNTGVRARQELAIAMNAAMGLNPSTIRLESGGNDGGVTLAVRNEEEDVIEAVADLPAGTRIQVKERFRPGLLVEFIGRAFGSEQPEETLLRTHCAWSGIPIELNGERISGARALSSAVGVVEVSTPECTGLAGLESSDDPLPRLEVLNNGVWLSTHVLPKFPPGFHAVVDGSALKKNVSHTDVVRDGAYEKLIAALRRAKVQVLCGAVAEYKAAGARDWLGAILKAALFQIGPRVPRHLENEVEASVALCSLPFWLTSTGGWISTAELLDNASFGFCPKWTEPVEVEGTTIVIAREPSEQKFLKELRPGKVGNRTRAIERALQNQANRKAWRERPHAPKLPDDFYYAREPINEDGVVGEIGLKVGGGQRATIRMVVDGCLLYEIAVNFPFPGVRAVLSAPLTPTKDFRGAYRDTNLAYCAKQFLVGLEKVFRVAARRWGPKPLEEDVRRMFLRYVVSVEKASFRGWVFGQFGFTARGRKRQLEKLGIWRHRPQWKLDSPSRHPLGNLRLWPTVDAQTHSLARLVAFKAAGTPIPYINHTLPAVSEIEQLVLRLTDAEARALETLLGPESLEDFEPKYQRLLELDKFRLRPLAGTAILDGNGHELQPGQVLQSTGFEFYELAGVVALVRFTLEMKDGEPYVPQLGLDEDMAHARVLHERRHLCDHWFSYGVPGIKACIYGDAIVPDADFSDLEGETWVEAGAILGKAVAQLVGNVAELHGNTREPGTEVRQCLLLTIRAAFESSVWVRIYSNLTRRYGKAAGEQYGELQRLCWGYSDWDVEAECRKALNAGELIDVDQVRTRIEGQGGADWSRYGPEIRFREALGPHLGEILGVPVFPSFGRTPLTGSELLRLVDDVGHLAVVPGDVARRIPYNGAARTLLPLDELLEYLYRHLFGSDLLDDCTQWLEDWDSARQLQTRDKVSQLKVAESSTIARLRLEGKVEGELALPPHHPLRGAACYIQLCKELRPVCAIQPALAIPVAAVLNDDALEVEQGSGPLLSVARPDERRIKRLVRDKLDDLVAQIDTDRLTHSQCRVARAYVLRYMAYKLPDRATDRSIPMLGVLRTIAELEVFEDVHGSWHSLIDLEHRYQRDGHLRYTTGGLFDVPSEAFSVIIRADERQELEILFPQLRDLADELRIEQEVRLRKSKLHPLAKRPDDALMSVTLDQHGLSGELWIDAAQAEYAEVGFGRDALAVGATVLDDRFPCYGAVTGEGLQIGEKWDSYEITLEQYEYLSRATMWMYEQLAQAALEPKDEAHEPKKNAVGWLLGAMARPQRGEVRALRNCVLALHRRRQKVGIFGQRAKTLYRQLIDLPMFSLSSGKFISLRKATQERPVELAYLYLWGDDEPEETVSELVEEVLGPDDSGEWDDDDDDEDDEEDEDDEPPPQPEPRELLLHAIREELRLVRTSNQNLLADRHLEMLQVGPDGGHPPGLCTIEPGKPPKIVLWAGHPLVRIAIETRSGDPVVVSFLASVAYTALNVALEEIEDHHEHVFHGHHAAHVLSGLTDGNE